MSRRRVTERESRGIARRQRAEPGVVRNTSVPNRGSTDAYGNTFTGFDSMKLAAQILSDETLHHKQSRPSYLDGIGLPGEIRSLPNAVILTRENIRGPIIASANIDGRIGAEKLSIPGLADNASTAAGRAVDRKTHADFVAEVEAGIRRKASRQMVRDVEGIARNRTTPSEARRIARRAIRDLVKKDSLK